MLKEYKWRVTLETYEQPALLLLIRRMDNGGAVILPVAPSLNFGGKIIKSPLCTVLNFGWMI
jgi:hypothetical protein